MAVASDAAGAATVSVGKTGSTQYLIANTNVKALGQTSSIANAALDEAYRFNADTQIIATLISAGGTATTGQVTVTFTYVQANRLQDKAANTYRRLSWLIQLSLAQSGPVTFVIL